jgi:hypothetical protein
MAAFFRLGLDGMRKKQRRIGFDAAQVANSKCAKPEKAAHHHNLKNNEAG